MPLCFCAKDSRNSARRGNAFTLLLLLFIQSAVFYGGVHYGGAPVGGAQEKAQQLCRRRIFLRTGYTVERM